MTTEDDLIGTAGEAANLPAPLSDDAPVYYLIDGSGYIFRAYHAIPDSFRRADGTLVNAVHGFAAMLMKLLGEVQASHMAVIFDAARVNFRNEIYPDYKANRDDPPEDLVPQFALIREATRAFNLAQVEVEGYEADDLIATYCRLARATGARVVVVSSDKDLMQLVGDGVSLLDPMKNRSIGPAEVAEKFGVAPDRVVDVQALAGDSIDNVPGVPGIGIKTAAQLITQFGDLDTLLDRAGEIPQPKRRQNLMEHAEAARLSRRLVALADDAPVPLGLDALAVQPIDVDALTGFLATQGFRTITQRAREQFGGNAPAPAPAPAGAPVAADYELVQDEDRLDAWIADATAAGIVAVDTETTSLNAMTARLVGVSLAIAPSRACYIPLAHDPAGGGLALEAGDARPRQIPMDRALARLKTLLEDDSVLKVAQNLKYDWLVLVRHGIRIAPADDTMLMSYALDGGRHGHGMDELARRHLDHETIPYSSVCGSGRQQITFDQVPLDKARDYAAEDADVTLRLHGLFRRRLVADRMTEVYETLDRPLPAIVAAMEQTGVKVDRAVLARLSGEFAERLAALEATVHELAGTPFNLGSPKQLGEVLFDRLGLPGGKKGKAGAYSTDVSVLEPLAAQGHDVVARLLDWRQLAKLKSTYTDALIGEIHPETGRVHTSYGLAATNTGRLSSTDPNLQNIPIRTEEGRKIREAFVAEDGWRLVSVDYSQIELRLVAHIAGIEALKQAFRDGVDIHAKTAAEVFGVPLAEMTGELRRQAKAINFGIIYGISAFGLANQLGIAQGEAAAFIKTYLARFGELKAWMDATKKAGHEKGFVTTLWGRKVHLPSIADKNPARRGFAERQAINAPIQGTAADIMKRAMIQVARALPRSGLQARMLLQVHDELLFEAPAAEVEETKALVRREMERAAPLDIPLVADAGDGPTWAAAH